MAEFCPKCLNRINNTNYPESRYKVSKKLDLCECCGEWTHVVEDIYYEDYVSLEDLKELILLVWKIIILPVTIYKKIKAKKKG